MLSRRGFVIGAGAAVMMSRLSFSAEAVPSSLDHILLGSSDLDAGIAFVEQRTGVRAQYGGVHPGRGTRNALLSLGQLRYLEVIAPDPKQQENDIQPYAVQLLTTLKELTAPRLITWAAHPGDVDALADKLRQAGIAIQGVFPGSRKRDDGRVLKWKVVHLADDRHGILPFFIEWAADAVHPSADAPAGCKLEQFLAAAPNPTEFSATFQRLGIDISVVRGDRPQLRARIAGPKGKLEVTS